MVWSISISNEGWIQIREALKVLDFESLCKAIGDCNFTIKEGYHSIKGKPYHQGFHSWKKLSKAFKNNREALENEAYDHICNFDNCDNGGFYYWIDPEGYHRVDINEGAFTFNDNKETIEILLTNRINESFEYDDQESPFDHMKALTEEIEGFEMVLERDSDIYRFSIPLDQSERLQEEMKGFYFLSDCLNQTLDHDVKKFLRGF